MLVTIEEMKRHLRVDSTEEDTDIQGLIDTAEAVILRQTGKTFTANKIAKQAVKILVTDFYENRSTDGEQKYSKTAEMLLGSLYYETDGS